MKKLLLLVFVLAFKFGFTQNSPCKILFDGVVVENGTVKKSDLVKSKSIVVVCDELGKSEVTKYVLEVWATGKGKMTQSFNNQSLDRKIIEVLSPGDLIKISQASVKTGKKINTGLSSDLIKIE